MTNELGDRTSYIGGSDIPVIMGVSPWKKRNALLREKITREYREFSSTATRFGHEKERTLIDFDALTEGYELTATETGAQHTLENPHFGTLTFTFPVVCHFDGIATMPDGEKVLIECKTSSTAFNGKLPEHYKPQVQFYLAALGFKRARIVFGLRDGDQIGEAEGFWVDADPEYFTNEILPAVGQFCKEINDGRARLAAGESIDAIVDDVVCDAVAIIGETGVSRANRALALMDRLTDMIDDFKGQIKQYMQDNGITKVDCGDYIVSLTAPTVSQRLNTAALKKTHPGIYEQFTTETKVAASLRITKKKAKE